MTVPVEIGDDGCGRRGELRQGRQWMGLEMVAPVQEHQMVEGCRAHAHGSSRLRPEKLVNVGLGVVGVRGDAVSCPGNGQACARE